MFLIRSSLNIQAINRVSLVLIQSNAVWGSMEFDEAERIALMLALRSTEELIA